jgi:hypothetical protein
MLRGIRAAQFLFFCIVFYLDILLSSYSRLTSSDYSFRIFKLLFYKELQKQYFEKGLKTN